MWRRMRARGHTQGLMYDVYSILAHQSTKYAGFTMDNMVGSMTSGPFPPMAPESAALVLLVMEYVWIGCARPRRGRNAALKGAPRPSRASFCGRLAPTRRGARVQGG